MSTHTPVLSHISLNAAHLTLHASGNFVEIDAALEEICNRYGLKTVTTLYATHDTLQALAQKILTSTVQNRPAFYFGKIEITGKETLHSYYDPYADREVRCVESLDTADEIVTLITESA